MPEKGSLHPIKKSNLEKHLIKVDDHMNSINRGGIERPSLFELLKGIGGDKHMMAKEVQDTVSILREGFELYYEMYAVLEEQAEKIDGKIELKEKIDFLGAYSMFVAASYIDHQLSLEIGDKETIPLDRKEGFFKFGFAKDDVLNDILAKYYGFVNTGKRSEAIKEGIDLPRASVEFFKFLRDGALDKKTTFHPELVDLVSKVEFRIADKFTISGFEVDYEEEHKKEKIEFVRMMPHQVAGNVLAKKEMLRDMDRIVLFDSQKKRNPILEVGGLSWSVLYDGLPGTGKSSLFKVGLSRLDERCEQINQFLAQRNMSKLNWRQLVVDQGVKDEYYGKTGKNLLEILNESKKSDGIYIVTMDDIDLLVSGDRNSSSGGSDKDILNILMQAADGINTIIRGNSQWWSATNDATAMDPALRQRFLARYDVSGPEEWYDFADITFDKLKTWIKIGIVDLPEGEGYNPYKMRYGQTGNEERAENSFLSELRKKSKGKITLRDIGELCRSMKDKNPRFTGRAVHAVSEAVKKRINDYEIPNEWYEKPEIFFFKSYDERANMLRELSVKVGGEQIIQEFERYFASEQRYSSDKFNSDVERGVHNTRVQLKVI
ncbi:MAG: AAA family ATPase, partial [Nanoarchaeota archaeon]